MNKTSLDVKEQIAKMWHQDEGPFENILRLVSYSPVLFAGIPGLFVTFLDKIASMLGYGVEDFGKWLDTKLGLGPGSEVTPQHFNNMQDLLVDTLTQKAKASENPNLVKVAFLGGIFRMIGGIPKFVKIFVTYLSRAVAFVLMAWGASNSKELYTKISDFTKKQVKETVEEVAKETLFGKQDELSPTDLMSIFNNSK